MGCQSSPLYSSPLPFYSTGLQLPTYIITIAYQSGQNHVIKVGNLTPTQSGYYVQLDIGNTVIVNQFGIDDVIEMLKSVTYTPTPSLTTTPLPLMSPAVSMSQILAFDPYPLKR